MMSTVYFIFYTGILEMVQDMGRCGHDRENVDGLATENFYLLFQLEDSVYLNKRLYLPSSIFPSSVTPVMSKTEEINL